MGNEEEVRGRGQPEGWVAVVEALHRLGKGIRINPSDALDPDHVADVLLDHSEALGASELLYLLSVLQVERLQELTTQACDRQYLFLNVAGLADETVVHLYAGHASGQREVPFRDWARKAVAQVIRRAVNDPDLAPFCPKRANPGEKIVMPTGGRNGVGPHSRPPPALPDGGNPISPWGARARALASSPLP